FIAHRMVSFQMWPKHPWCNNNLRIGFGGLYKGPIKTTIISPVNVIMPRLSREQRLRPLGMVEAGLSYSEIARRMGCSQPTIRNLVQRHTATVSVDDRPRPGRERVTTPQQDRYI
ncbi:Transposable element Tc1 transposase, partial [Clarias magur]